VSDPIAEEVERFRAGDRAAAEVLARKRTSRWRQTARSGGVAGGSRDAGCRAGPPGAEAARGAGAPICPRLVRRRNRRSAWLPGWDRASLLSRGRAQLRRNPQLVAELAPATSGAGRNERRARRQCYARRLRIGVLARANRRRGRTGPGPRAGPSAPCPAPARRPRAGARPCADRGRWGRRRDSLLPIGPSFPHRTMSAMADRATRQTAWSRGPDICRLPDAGR
jgi:hypothetical protein